MVVIAAWVVLALLGLVFAGLDALSAYDRWRLALVATADPDWSEDKRSRMIDVSHSTMLSQLANVGLFTIMLSIGVLAALDLLSTPFQWLMFSILIILLARTVHDFRFRRRMYGE